MPTMQLPVDVWRIVMEQLAHTDLLRAADTAARDIAAAACTCRAMNEASGAGWRALPPADDYIQGYPEGRVGSDVDMQFYNDAQRFAQGKVSVDERDALVKKCAHLEKACWLIEKLEYDTYDDYEFWCLRFLKRLLPLRSRSCCQRAVIAAVLAGHQTIKPADAVFRFRLTETELKALKQHERGYKLSEVCELAQRKWTTYDRLDVQYRKAAFERAEQCRERQKAAAQPAAKKRKWEQASPSSGSSQSEDSDADSYD